MTSVYDRLIAWQRAQRELDEADPSGLDRAELEARVHESRLRYLLVEEADRRHIELAEFA